MNYNFNCCGENFAVLTNYLQHLKSHEDNVRIYVRCVICNQTCISWDAFRKHNIRDHKDNNPIELFDSYINMIQNLSLNGIDSNVSQQQETHEIENNVLSDLEEDDVFSSDDLEKTKLNYGQYLLDITYQNELKAKTVDSLNANTKKLVVAFLNNLKVLHCFS